MSGIGDLLTAVTDFFRWCGDFLRNWSDEISDFLNAATTSTCIASPYPCLNDGPIVRVIKGQVNRIDEYLKDLLKPFEWNGSDTNPSNNDGTFTRFIKSQVMLLRTSIDLPIWSKTFNYGGSPAGISDADGIFVKFIKSQVSRIVTSIEKPEWLRTFDYGGSPAGISDADGIFVKFIKSQVSRIVTSIEKPEWSKAFYHKGFSFAEYLESILKELRTSKLAKLEDALYYKDFSVATYLDSILKELRTSKLAKLEDALYYKNFSVAAYMDSVLKELRTSKLAKLEDALYYKDFSVAAYMDSILKELRTSKLAKLEDALYYKDFSVATYLDSVLEELRLQTPLLKDIGNGGFDKDIIKIFEDIRDNIKKLGQTTGGKNIWDFLTELVGTIGKSLDSILDFVTNLGDWLIELVIPQDTTFVTTAFNDLKTQFDDKLSILVTVKSAFSGMFNDSESPLSDYTINLPIVGRPIQLLDMSIVSVGVPIFKKAMSGLIVIFTILHVYKKIVGTGGVMEK
ncbi:hypothetical protein MHB42_20615 [Lysinibacillus sp. FSL K6-0232]|uniref:hypothetical protein n=1 Tax=Lysinibacillus sp. FSL K6-0232 TaxID=2921425 RepID=UPI0030F68B4F